jgi:hypothetical protein
MGAGFRTFASGEVLTADNVQNYLMDQSVMVFAGTAARGSALPSPETGMTAYSTATGLQVYNGTSWVSIAPVTEVAAFSAGGTFTPPAGVTYAIAHIRAGGGGVGNSSSGAGGTSSVAFAGGTISATGGNGHDGGTNGGSYAAGQANSGQGAIGPGRMPGGDEGYSVIGRDGAYIVAGGAVTPGTGITVTVGAGGVAGTFGVAGGSGYVWIEYQV